jgi:hypothetical protein
MHEPLIAQAALPAQVLICGIPLKPYSLGHELFLIREQSPFVNGGQILPSDLFFAVWICSSTFAECKTASQSWTYLLKLWLLKRRVAKCNVEREAKAFREYQENGGLQLPLSDIPKPGEPKGRSMGSPFILLLHDFVCTRYHLTLNQAWDFPAGEAKCRWMAWRELEGSLEIYNEDNAAIDAKIQEAD